MLFRSKIAYVGVSTIALAGLLAGCASGDEATSGDSVTITYVGYGGDGQEGQIEAWQKPFVEANPGTTFVNTSPPDVSQVKAQVESGAVQWDVMVIAPYAAQENCGTLFEKLDASAVDESVLVEGSVGECYIANWINATPWAYRTDAFAPGQGPKTNADFFDVEKFPGQRGIGTVLQNGILEYALLADGVQPDDMYPLDIDRALKKLDTIRDHTTFTTSFGALQQAAASEQVDMFLLPDSRIVPMLKDGGEYTVVWDVTVAALNAFAVPLGSKNKEAATAFAASTTEIGPVEKISELLGVAPINTQAKPKLDKFAAQVEVFGDVNTGETLVQDVDWYAEHFNEVTTKLTKWLAG